MTKVRTTDLKQMKGRGERIAVLTAYDAGMARILDTAGIDVLLVGDSLGMVVLGYDTTIPVTMGDMVHHTRAVVRGTSRALVVADMPFLSYQIGVQEAIRNAGRLIQEGGAAAVKIEGGKPVVEVTRRLVEIGIPVMAHLGLTPQSVHQLGGFRAQARTPESAQALLEDALSLEQAGAFAMVLESIPDEVAARVTESLSIPTIGIGAGPRCDGQVLVSNDVLGLYGGYVPSFVKQYANLNESILEAVRQYAQEVKQGEFPAARTAEPVRATRVEEK
jgi:3-methyl-2-oxobutanoate hydroxymethyltransferase